MTDAPAGLARRERIGADRDEEGGTVASRVAALARIERWSRQRALLVSAAAAVLLLGFRGAWVLTPDGGSDAAHYLAYASYLARHHRLPPASFSPNEYSTPPLFEAVAGLLNYAGHRLPSIEVGLHAQLASGLVWLALVGASCAALSAGRRAYRSAGAGGLAIAGVWGLDEAITVGKLHHFSEGQLLSLLETVGLVWVTALIARELWPDRPRRALAAAAVALCYPVVLRLGVMFHPEMTLAFLCAVAFLFMLRGQRRGWPWMLGAATGVALGLAADVRQSATIVIVGVAVAVALAGGARALRFALAGVVCLALVAGPWWAYATVKWGSPVKLALDLSGKMERNGEPLSFFVSFPIVDLVTHPYRPDFENELLPVLHADLWSDWYGSLHGDNTWKGQSRLARLSASTQSVLGFGGDALGLLGLVVVGGPSVVRLLRRRLRGSPDFARAFLAVLVVAAFAAFVATILRYPQVAGKEIKASYMLFTTPAWALFAVSGWLWLGCRSRVVGRVVLPAFAVAYLASYAATLYAVWL